MKSKKIRILILVLLLIISGFLVWYFLPSPAEAPIKINEIEEEVVEFQKTSIIGKTVLGHDIVAESFGNGDQEILLVGGIHGGYEWNTVLLANKMIDHISQNADAVPENLTVTVIPALNIDGVLSVASNIPPISSKDIFEAGSAYDVITNLAPENFLSVDNQKIASGRFNANNVDLNRNFDCNWQPKATWRSQNVSAGTSAFSEPEALAIKNYVEKNSPVAVIFWHSASNAVYGSGCGTAVSDQIKNLMQVYASSAGYKMADTFTAYPITGDAGDWLSTIGISAIAVELKTHEDIEWEKNLAGTLAVINNFSQFSK